ncbi:IS110 family RNA-guided transposase [Litoribacter populi]|uniref:IS110 family transposase n=1 Tax=Litoribacter populi TaxID=2598460 RepID=UPI00117FFA36|nr:IS110 family transposase [Litoribacter populi]
MPRTKVNQKSFEGQCFYIGIDDHLRNWLVSIFGELYEHKTMSRDRNPDQLADYMNASFPGGTYKAVYEAGFSGFGTCRRLNELGIECMVLNAADVPTSQKERLQKNDSVDARKLARMLRGGELEGIHVPDTILEADRTLCRVRDTLVKDMTRNKSRVKSILMQFGVEIPARFSAVQTRSWSKVYMEWVLGLEELHPSIRQTIAALVESGMALKKNILNITRQIRELAESDRYRDNCDRLITIPGVGLVTAMNLLTQLGDIERFKTLDELCHYIGIVPNTRSSGEKTATGKITRRGRKKIKILLIEASWVAVRKDPALMAKFNELSKRMNKNKAIIRIAKSLLNRIRHMLRHKTEYVTGVTG